MTDVIYIPFSKELYDDLIRFSDGRFDVAWWAEERLSEWIVKNLEGNGYEGFWREFDGRVEDLAEKYAPHVLDRWADKDAAAHRKRRPLVWKEVVVPAGSDVRMSYGGKQHYAVVEDEAIIDEGKRYSPNEWASKVAGSARNAWRDLWFKKPGGASTWEPAVLLRQRARTSLDEEEGSQ